MFKKRTRISILLMLMMAIVLVFTACNNDEVPEEPSDQVQDESTDEIEEDSTDADAGDEEQAWELAVETPEGKTVELTDSDIEEIGKVDIQATIRKKDGTEEENKWSGMPLSKVLDFAGINEYTLIEVEAADGFSVEYTPEIVESNGTILATEVDGEKLDEDSGPIQSVVDGEGAKLWIKQVVKVKAIN